MEEASDRGYHGLALNYGSLASVVLPSILYDSSPWMYQILLKISNQNQFKSYFFRFYYEINYNYYENSPIFCVFLAKNLVEIIFGIIPFYSYTNKMANSGIIPAVSE